MKVKTIKVANTSIVLFIFNERYYISNIDILYSSSRYQINLIILLDEDKFTRRSKRIIEKNKKCSGDIYATNKSIIQNDYTYIFIYSTMLNDFFFRKKILIIEEIINYSQRTCFYVLIYYIQILFYIYSLNSRNSNVIFILFNFNFVSNQ